MQTVTLGNEKDVSLGEIAETLTLIDGNFSCGEAKEVISKLLADKINFLKIKNWSSRERFGKDDEFALERIQELNTEISKLQDILSLAKEYNKRLVVNSHIDIKLVDC